MSKEEKFDWLLSSINTEHKDGIPDFLDTIFAFLYRKTNFYVDGVEGAPEKLLMEAFLRYKDAATGKRTEEMLPIADPDKVGGTEKVNVGILGKLMSDDDAATEKITEEMVPIEETEKRTEEMVPIEETEKRTEEMVPIEETEKERISGVNKVNAGKSLVNNMPISISNVLDHQVDEGRSAIKMLREDITVLWNRARITSDVLRSQGKQDIVNKSETSNVLAFSLHSLGQEFKPSDYGHIVKILNAKIYLEKCSTLCIKYEDILTLNSILMGQSDINFSLDPDKLKRLQNYILFVNASFENSDENLALLWASAALFDYLQIGIGESRVAEIVSQLVFNVILTKRRFPTTIFPVHKENQFRKVTTIVQGSRQYKEFMELIYTCVRDSLLLYMKPLTEELENEKKKRKLKCTKNRSAN